MLIDDMYAVYPSYLSPFPPNRHKQKPIIALLSQYLRLQYTLFAIISLLSLTSILHTVQNYHRWLILPYRPDQIEQQLTLYGTRILLMAMSSSHLCSFVFDTDVMPYQLTSYDTNEFQQMVDFLLTDFNDSTGVGTSTSCFCLNYHNFLHLHILLFLAQVIGSNNVSSFFFSIDFLRYYWISTNGWLLTTVFQQFQRCWHQY